MKFIADLHIHSHYSMATSKDADPENIYRWAVYKGVTLVGSGDFTHPGWRQELKEKLVPAGEGLYRLKDELCRQVEEDPVAGLTPTGPEGWGSNAGNRASREAVTAGSVYLPLDAIGRPVVRFVISGEISTIYKQGGRTRKVHHLILLPGLEAAAKLSRRLEEIGNLHSDGRPILGLDSRRLLEMTLEACPEAIFIPAHIWTPHFSLFGANSGFDALEECYGDLAKYIFAVETGLSSDPPMNWRLSVLDPLTLVSNSDAHSPRYLAREANLFDAELAYPAIRHALQEREAANFLGTLEFFPQEGKYHLDGHRNCQVCWQPAQTRAAEGICPVCGRKLTIGVLHRVEELADREGGFRPQGARPFESLVPLPEVLASALGVGATSKKVTGLYLEFIQHLGPELLVLREAPLEAIARVGGPTVAEAIRRMRTGEVESRPGFDGEYGRILLLRPGEREFFSGQEALFPEPGPTAAAGEIAAAQEGLATATEVEVTAAAPATPISRAPRPGTTRREPASSPKGGAGGAPAGAAGSRRPVPANPAGDQRTGYTPYPAAGPGSGGILAGLNEEQRQAVTAAPGPVIVVAGPGTGKTSTLVHRLAYLIGVRGIDPGRITAVTFTNKAAGEIRYRVAELLGTGEESERVTIGTFHSLCLDLLQDGRGPGATGAAGATGTGAAAPAGQRPLTVLDENDTRSLLAEVLREKGQPGARKALRLQRQISLLKGRGLMPASPGVPEDLRPVYQAYQERLAEYSVLDYDDLLLQAVELVRGWRAAGGANPEVVRILERFTHLLVDEFQDVNPVQYALVKLWAGEGSSLFVIGDPDQAIYGFRGASNRFFEQLRQDYPAAQVWQLTCNYRSTPTILRAATAVIAHNRDNIHRVSGEPPLAPETSPPVPGTESPGAGGMVIPGTSGLKAVRESGLPVLHLEVPGEMAEGIAIVREISRLLGGTDMLRAHGQGGVSLMGDAAAGEGEGWGFADIAVLARTGRQLELLEECFLREGIPYRVLGRESFLEERPVREALAFCRCLVNPADDWHLLFYLGTKYYRSGRTWLKESSRQAGIPAWQVLEELARTGGRPAGVPALEAIARERLLAFKDTIDRYRALMATQPPAVILARWIAEHDLQQVDSLQRLARVAERFQDLPSFLRGVTLAGEADHERYGGNVTSPEVVSLMTIHAAKGLEFPVVFIAGVEDGLLPLQKNLGLDLDAEDLHDLQEEPSSHPSLPTPHFSLTEERRLFYVGLTRARDRLILVSARSRAAAGVRTPAQPSPFLLEIPPDCLEKKAWTGKAQGEQGNSAGGYKQLTLF
ncbi:MAG: hypothetical protein PWQ18_770 [Clostridia bacterium]|nr:hypothetical protein [Clostridia bacterium]